MSEANNSQTNRVIVYREPHNLLDPPSSKGRFHITMKPVGSACNLGCTYCYYLSKAQLLNQSGDRRIDQELLECCIQQCIEAQDGAEIIFTWHGGEPTLLGLDFFRKAVALQNACRPYGQRILNDLQTNGTLLNDEWCKFLKEHDFLVGISIDGPRDLHDAYRLGRRGEPSFDRVMRGISLLQKHNVPYSTLTVVNRLNARKPLDVYRFLRRQARSDSIQFIPCVEPKSFHSIAPQHWPPDSMPVLGSRAARPGNRDSVVTDWSVDPDDWGTFLSRTFDEWYKKDFGQVLVNLFETAVAQRMGLPAQTCATAEFCGKGPAMEHDGTVYACDHYAYPEFALGNIQKTHLGRLAYSASQQKFGFVKCDALTEYCRKCRYLQLCWGECPRNRFIRTPEGEAGLNYLCSGIKRFHTYAEPALDRIVRTVTRPG